jgi:hypothetical protein
LAAFAACAELLETFCRRSSAALLSRGVTRSSAVPTEAAGRGLARGLAGDAAGGELERDGGDAERLREAAVCERYRGGTSDHCPLALRFFGLLRPRLRAGLVVAPPA